MVTLLALALAGCGNNFQPDFPSSSTGTPQAVLSTDNSFTVGYSNGAYVYSDNISETRIAKDYVHRDIVEIDANGDEVFNIEIVSEEDTLEIDGVPHHIRYLTIAPKPGTDFWLNTDYDDNVDFFERGVTVTDDFEWTVVEEVFYIASYEKNLVTEEIRERIPPSTIERRYIVFRMEYAEFEFEGWIEIIPEEFDNFRWKNFATFLRKGN